MCKKQVQLKNTHKFYPRTSLLKRKDRGIERINEQTGKVDFQGAHPHSLLHSIPHSLPLFSSPSSSPSPSLSMSNPV